MPTQLHFDLPVRVSFGEDDFYVSDANRAAYGLICEDARWPEGKLAVIGPTGCGKTHLARLWQDRTGATRTMAADLDPDAPLPAPGTRLVVEDMEGLAPAAQEYLFHVHNHLRSSDGRLLMTASTPPPRWPITLPDLASRVQAATTVPIRDPDDALLRAVLTKHFTDRQLKIAPARIDQILRRIERSFDAAGQIVARLDAAALANGRVINQTLVRDILATTPGAAD